MQDLYISMLGAQGTGKSSLLASMYYTFKKNAGELGFIMKPASAEDSNQLSEKHEEMLEHLHGVRGTDNAGTPTEVASEYVLDLGFLKNNIPDYWLKLHFWDFPGGWLLENRDAVVEQLNKSDVILIAIDTPSLVVDDKHGNYQLWHEKKNRPHAIADIFMEIDFSKPKLILFVPIKCEAWRTSTKGSELIVDQVRKGYDGLIAALKMYADVTVATTSVQTLGNYLWNYRISKTIKNKVTLQDKFIPFNAGVNGNAEYSPREIDQPLIYILSFLAKQVRENLADIQTRTDERWENQSWWQSLIKTISGERAEYLQARRTLFTKLSQLEHPIDLLNKKRMDSKKDGFEVIQGRQNLL
jgi:hypothetical protein